MVVASVAPGASVATGGLGQVGALVAEHGLCEIVKSQMPLGHVVNEDMSTAPVESHAKY